MKKFFILLLVIVLGSGVFFVFRKIFSSNEITRALNENQQRGGVESDDSIAATQKFDPALLNWDQVSTSSIPWSKRDAHAVVVFKNKLWLMGGLEGDKEKNYWEMPHKSDIWISENGKDWQLVADNAPWGKRRSITATVFKDKLWVIGGWRQDGRGYDNTVWYSEDGVSWQKAEPFPLAATKREGHTMIVFKDKLWMMGGVRFDTREAKNDVWYSDDGIKWTEATAHAPWRARYDHAVAVLKNKIWLTGGMPVGGLPSNDLWVSDDGINWELVTQNAPWPQRHGHSMEVFQDRLWILGGWSEPASAKASAGKQTGGLSDVWYSEDGREWKKTAQDAPWIGREDHASAVFHDRIWLMGGMGANWIWQNDVWHTTTDNYAR